MSILSDNSSGVGSSNSQIVEVVSNLNHDKIDLDFRGVDDDQQGPVQIQKAVSNLDLERNQEDLGFAGTRLIVRPDSRT